MLSGGRPNSPIRTIEAVDTVLSDPTGLEELYRRYSSDDEVMRLRPSDAVSVQTGWNSSSGSVSRSF